jgi:uncharacterized membrane protein YhaH (DUF805 family)
LGLVLQGLVAVSLPGTLGQRWWTHGLKVLYAFEVVMIVFAMLFGGSEARSFSLAAAGVTLALHLLSVIIGDLMLEAVRWRKRVVNGLVLVTIALAVAGGLALWNAGWRAVLCGAPSERHANLATQKFCDSISTIR